jgi:hypothetical protein
VPVDLSKAVIDLEIRPDGSVRFEVSGLPGPACQQLEVILLEVLQGEVTERSRTAEFYEEARQGLGQRIKALLGRG